MKFFSESGNQRYIILSEGQLDKHYMNEIQDQLMSVQLDLSVPLNMFTFSIINFYSFSPLPSPLKFLDHLTESLLIIRIID